MDRFIEMNVFVAVAETGGFASGARKLGISPPVATRAVADLEQRLGVSLLTRTTRYVRVTDAGKRYFEDAKRILGEVAEADEAACGINGEPSGHLAITAPVLFGRMFVLPVVINFLDRYPNMTISGLYLDRVVNLLEEGVDIGVRIGDLADSGMHAIRVGSVRKVVCASAAYLAKHGVPQTPEDLSQHQVICAASVNPTIEWRFSQDKTLRIKPRLSLTTNDSAIDAAVAHFGIVRQMFYQVAPQIERGELTVVLADFEPQALPIHVVHREGRRTSTKIRSFMDLLVERLRADKAIKYAEELPTAVSCKL